MARRSIIITLLLFFSASTRAAEGPVRLRVLDASAGDPLVEARVQVVRGGTGYALTDLEGRCSLDLPAGPVELRVSADFHRPRRVAVTVEPGGPTVTIKLRSDEEQVQEVVVVGVPDTATEAVQLVRRQKAATVSDAVSAEQIARTPDSSAGDAVKRVVAATVIDGKYVIVRGLGGRYTSTLLNGVTLPSPDPDNPAAPLDLFPAALLANLTVSKTFSPDIPGNFAGGSLSIETRDFPSAFTLKLRTTTAADTVTTFRPTATSRSARLDWLGFDDGTRALPEAVPDQRVTTSGDRALAPDQVNGIAQSFNNNWGIGSTQARPAFGLTGTIGDTLAGGGAKLGYLASMTYGNKWSRRIQKSRTVADAMTANQELDVDTGIHSTALGGLANVGLAMTPTQRLRFIGLYSHSSDDTAQTASGVTEAGRNFNQRSRVRFVERQLSFGQLSGEHAFANQKLVLGWQGNISVVTQSEPDVRDVNYVRIDSGQLKFDPGPGSGDRYYVDLGDLSGGGSVNLTWAFAPLKLKLGGAAQLTSRELAARRFNFTRANGVDANDPRFLLPPEELFSPDNMGPLLRLAEATRTGDGYDFTRNIFAGYAMIDLVALEPLRLVTGARVELAHQSLQDSTAYSGAPLAQPTVRDDVNVLPAMNAILALGSGQNLRASYSMTVARPHVREIAPFKFNDYARGRVSEGNPDVLTTRVHNADLRWELFFGNTDLVAVSAFYKRFIDPIEAVINANNDVTYRNALRAHAFGGELEGRFALPLHFRTAANLTLITSTVEFDPMQAAAQTSKSRPLQGQSPYVANVELGWGAPRTGSDFTLLYNVFGRRVSEAGISMAPDTYEQPFHRLDFTYTQKLPQSLLLKLSATNLLNQRVQFKQGEVEVLGYDAGVAFIASMEWAYGH